MNRCVPRQKLQPLPCGGFNVQAVGVDDLLDLGFVNVDAPVTANIAMKGRNIEGRKKMPFLYETVEVIVDRS